MKKLLHYFTLLRRVPHIIRNARVICDFIIVDFSGDQKQAKIFRASTKRALVKLRSKDSRRFRRVCTFLNGIGNISDLKQRDGYFASFIQNKNLKACLTDFSKYDTSLCDCSNHINHYSSILACILVHEGTHGYIEARSISYSPENREQIERLCHDEEMRFAKKLGDDFFAYYHAEFDFSYYEEYWSKYTDKPANHVIDPTRCARWS
jgi:hypothetical protein